LRADGVILPGNTIIPRWIDFSSRIPSNLPRSQYGFVVGLIQLTFSSFSRPHFVPPRKIQKFDRLDLSATLCRNSVDCDCVISAPKPFRGIYELHTPQHHYCWRTTLEIVEGPYEFHRRKPRNPKRTIMRRRFQIISIAANSIFNKFMDCSIYFP
jgi:hypothetical protein